MPDEKVEIKDEVKEPAKQETFEETAAKLAKEMGIDEKGNKIEEEKEEKDEKASKKDSKKDDKENKDDNSKEDDAEDEDEEDELDEESLGKAKYIYKLLNNPKTSIKALEVLAQTAGFSLQEVKESTKEEKKEIVKSIKDIVKERLGTKIPFLSEELGQVLEETIQNAVKEHTKDLRQQVESEAQARQQEKLTTAFEKVTSSYNGITDAILKEIVRIQENKEIIPGTMEPEKYFKTCVILAADNLGVTVTKRASDSRLETKVEKKEVDALSSLRGQKNITHKEGLKTTQIKTISDAINAAAEKLDAEFAKK